MEKGNRKGQRMLFIRGAAQNVRVGRPAREGILDGWGRLRRLAYLEMRKREGDGTIVKKKNYFLYVVVKYHAEL